jgi:hypothetical protein
MSLRPGEDEVNSVFIRLLDQMDASDWVPVEARARCMTIQAVSDLASQRAVLATQADAHLAHIRQFCGEEETVLAAAWREMLCEPNIEAWQGDRKVDISDRVQGFAMLGLIRLNRQGDLQEIMNRLAKDEVQAPVPVLSQALIFLSGPELQRRLDQWLTGPPLAKAAGVQAARLLQVRIPKGAEVPKPAEIEAARKWVKTISNGTPWGPVIEIEMRRFIPEAEKGGKEAEVRLKRIRQLLGIPTNVSVVPHLRSQPAAARLKAFERLAGIDSLVDFSR